MSLQIWLPLNGSLENQGLNPMTFSFIGGESGIGINNIGKIGGKCYERISKTGNCIRGSETLNLKDDISMCCWAYVTGTEGSANGLVTNHDHSINSGVGITVRQISSTDFRISCNTGNGTNRTYNEYYGTTNIANAWHHLTLTYNKSKKQLKLYVNGNLEYTLENYSNYAENNNIDIFNWSTTWYTNSSYKTLCKLNDIRIYDNCLSPKEIKEISNGLILHYPMRDEENDNIHVDSSGYGNNANTAVGKTIYLNTSPRGYGCSKLDGSAYLKTNNILIPQQHTISFWINRHSAGHFLDWRAPEGEAGIQPVYFNDSGQIQYFSSAKTDATVNYFNDSVVANEWHYVALACNGTSVKYYLDGEYKQTKQTATAENWNNPLSIGARVTNTNIINAEISDLRIYATELSAEEVLKLYNTPIWIDENQILGAVAFEESEVINNNKFNKNGNICTQDISTIKHNDNVKIKMLSDGSAWAKIYYLDLDKSETCFTDAEINHCVNKDNRFSLMGDIDNFKGSSLLPVEYTKLEYIESNGTQYINTGYYWTKENIKIVFDGMVTNNGASQSLFGAEEYIEASGNNRNFSGIPHGANGSFGIYLGNGNQGTVACGLNTRFNLTLQTTADKKLTVLLNGTEQLSNKTYTNSVLAKSGAYLTSSASTTVGNIFLFANHNSNRGSTNEATQQVGGMKLYKFQMWDGENLVRSFIPCKNASGTIGLYDGITKQFFTNAGSGNFIAGPIVTNREIPGAGYYEFMLTYPDASSILYNRWEQTISPNSESATNTSNTGYKAIHTDFTNCAAPLRKTPEKYQTSATYACNITSNWWAPIGQKAIHQGGIPAANGAIQRSTELWARIDILDSESLNEIFSNDNAKVKIYNNYILAKDIIEI